MTVLSLLLLATAAATGGHVRPSSTEVLAPHTIPAGQEQLLLRMLNLPSERLAGCSFDGAGVQRHEVVARYACPGSGLVEVILRHPTEARQGDLLTQHFVVSTPEAESIPAALRPAIVAGITASEEGWSWRPPRVRPPPPESPPAEPQLDGRGWPPPGLVPPLVGWALVLGFLLLGAPGLLMRRPADAVSLLLLAFAGLALCAIGPWGPMDFAEAERLAVVWDRQISWPQPAFSSMVLPLQFLSSSGILSVEAVLRWTGPVMGAAGVVATYLLARAAGLGLRSSILAATIVLVFPPHLRFSGTTLSMAGGAFLAGAFAAAASQRLGGRWRVVLTVGLALLASWSRPELFLGLAGLVPLLFMEHWTRREAIAAVSLFLAVAAISAPDGFTSGTLQSAVQLRMMWLEFWAWTLRDWFMNASWWLVAGLVGLLCRTLPKPIRRGLLLSSGALLSAWFLLAFESNPVWGFWRYAIVLTPMVAVGAAAVVERFSFNPGRTAVVLSMATSLSLVGSIGWVLARADLQEEFAWVRRTSPQVENRTVLAVDGWLSETHDGSFSFAYGVGMALASRLPVSFESDACGAVSGKTAVRPLEEVVTRCPERLFSSDVVLFLGLSRPEWLMSRLADSVVLQPLEITSVTAYPVAGDLTDQGCRTVPFRFEGSRTRPCRLEFGWYRAHPIGQGPSPVSATDQG